MTAPLIWPAWGRPVDVERRNRIRLAVYAYAYEFHDVALVTDAEFDTLALSIRPHITTGKHDAFFRETFQPHTGQWIHEHPDLPGIARLYAMRYAPS